MSESMRAECDTHDCNGHSGCGGCISHKKWGVTEFAERNVGRRGICDRDYRIWWWRRGGALQHIYRCRRKIEQGIKEERKRLGGNKLLIGAVFVEGIVIVVVGGGCATTSQQIVGRTERCNLTYDAI